MASSPSFASIPLEKTTSDLVAQLKYALAGIVADRQEFEDSCQSASLQDVQDAMGKLLSSMPKERTKAVRIIARYVGAVDKFADMVAPIVSAGQPIAPTVFASIAVILKLYANREKSIQTIADTFLLFEKVLPTLQLLSSFELHNAAVNQVFSGMIKFLVEAAKFLARKRFGIFSFSNVSDLQAASDRFQSDINITHFMVFTDSLKDQKKIDILKRINLVPYDADLEALRSARLADTCLWALAHPVIANWMDSTADHIWLHGGPGSGKSIIAAFLIDSVRDQISRSATNGPPSEIVLYFFCDSRSGSSMKRTSISIVKSLLTQLVESPLLRLEHFSEFVEYMVTKGFNFDYPLQVLVKHLMVILKQFSKTWIIIDALDECHEEVVGPNGIVQMLQTPSKGVNLKLACLSRKEVSIEKRLSGWPRAEVGENDTTENDIRRFTSVKVGEVGSKDHYPGGPAELENYIVRAAGNMFLYIVLKVENLKHLTPEEMTKEINRSPEELDDLYAAYLDRTLGQNQESDNESAIRALQWIVYSRQSVTLTVLAGATVVDGDNKTMPIVDVQSVRKRLEKVFGILVVFRPVKSELQVTLVHQTLKDFLVRSGDENQKTLVRVADQSRILIRLKSHDQQSLLYNTPYPIRKPIRDTELYVLCDPMRPWQSHMRFLETCVIAISSVNFLIPSQAYNDSFDERREGLSRKERGGKLERELCHGEQWGKRKEMRQLRDLDATRVRRGAEITEIQNRLASDLAKDVGPLQHIRQLHQKRLEELIRWRDSIFPVEREEVRSLHEHEMKDLLEYVFGNFSSHLGQVIQCGYGDIHDPNRPTILLSFLLNTYLDRVENFTSSVAANAHLRLQSLQQRPNHSSHLASFVTTLRNFRLAAADIRGLSLAFNKECQPLAAGILTYRYWRWSLFPRFSNTAENLENLLHGQIMAAPNEVEAIQERRRLTALFGLLTQALTTLRRCEVALYALDEEWMVIVGASNLIDASHRAAQVFVRSAVYQTCAHLPETARHELAAIFEKDDFMNSVVLQPLRRSSMDQRKESIRQLLEKHYHQHPFAFATLFLLFLVAGAKNWIFMWIPVLTVLSCSRGDLNECRHSDPSIVHEIMHILTPSFIIGRVLFLGYRIAVPSALIISIILTYTSLLVYHIFRLCGKHHIWSAPYRVSVLNWSVVFVLLWQGVISALFQDISILKVLNAFTAHLISYNIVTIVIDGDDVLRASTQLKQFSACSVNKAPVYSGPVEGRHSGLISRGPSPPFPCDKRGPSVH
ncbi:hypothetical protein IW261DRAFT_923000 [Armillaria novae-zelandiae]|uniref:Nephrocystin 3-like N-terminal domain-containing protein n=1 Tax=Armillaria novae-zelandiae TaxID=153914 RepID=A0AA39NSH4_9AGAR|nr:hypothetical protein IW261DRAFT_1015759 [Armillaria novae-zelandiae]KAK0470870.1 hypothetical protein IW261DRAFT_923000 [Armillaria novae-zelandiae]